MGVPETEEPSKDEPPEASPRPPGGVRWHDDVDVEAARPGPSADRPALHRNISQGSLSIHSVRSTSGAIDPSAALPIQYRTL